MNRYKRLYILLGVLAVASVLTFGVLQIEAHQEKIQNSDKVVLEVDTDAIQFLSWEYGEEAFSLRKEDHWIYEADEAFPVDDEVIDGMLEQFQSFGVSFIIEDVEDYGQYGLENPICTINMATETENYQILLGDYSEMDAQRYVSIGDGNAYLVRHDPLDEFNVLLNGLIQHDEIPTFEQVQKLTLSGEEELIITYEEDGGDTYRAEDVYFTQRSGERIPMDPVLVESYLSAVEYLYLTDYVTYNAAASDLKRYGLDDPDLTIAVDYTWTSEEDEEVSDTFTLSIARDPAEKTADEADEDGEENSAEEITAYARVKDSKIIYKLSGTDYTTLMQASYDDLRHRAVIPADLANISQLDISLEGEDYTITSELKDDERIYFYQEQELESVGMQEALTGLVADSFTDEVPTQKKEIGLTVYLDLENQPVIDIELYRYDGSNCLAVVDGKSVSLVPREAVVSLIEAVNEIVLN